MTIGRTETKGQTVNNVRPVVEIKNLVKSFSGRTVLDNVDFTVDPGNIVSIIGRSGGGKTTLMRCINLLEQPDSGSIALQGEPVFAGRKTVCKDLAKLRQQVGMVFQRFYLFPHLTAVENVMLAQMKGLKIPEKQALHTALELLAEVGLSHRALAFPEQMSGGEQQRVAIARALALGPSLLLFDEPTSALDPESTRDVLAVMRRLARSGMTMVIVTHEVPFAKEISDQIVFIDGGHIIEQGPPSAVIDNPREERTKAFLRSYNSDS
ncbi:amino acid ABC transporter ATP-binding protein [Paenarthrobacter sp. NPDC057981]|uniref:amino acid ABC transporter ATP-binding protein n=1 Tax=Paenarthrobacter sp. NPDC057981 TaxID=3346297 RepID=UPI0036DB08A3